MKAVVFDMDGVIFDSERRVLECWQEVAANHGLEGIEGVFYNCLGLNRTKTMAVMLGHYGEDFPYEEFRQEASVLFHSRYDGGRLPMKSGAIELLAMLKERGMKVALATSTRSQSVLPELRDAGILPYFDAVVCGDMVENGKPAPDIFLKACELVGVAPEEAFGIEDSFNGVRSATSAGLRTIMVPDMKEPDEELRGLAEVVLPSLVEVREYILSDID